MLFLFFQIFANSIGEEVSMVQEIAQEIIRSARKKGAQDIYFVPKLDAYELHMRVGDERCKIGCYDFEKFAAVISHFSCGGYECWRKAT